MVRGQAVKFCIGCKHLDYDSATYGEYGEAGKFFCRKGHWKSVAPDYMSMDEFAAEMAKADTCQDFSERAVPHP